MSISKAKARRSPASFKHLILSAGGSRAILGGSGAIAALEQAGVDDWQTIGGVSGGSIPSLLKAYGYSAKEIMRMAVDIDFQKMLARQTGMSRVIVAYLMKGRYEKTRPRQGVFNSKPLGDYIENLVGYWPKGYWTMAVAGDNQILFNENGVYEISPDGTNKMISKGPAPLGVAIRASCSVPGILSAVPFKGRYLFDGALSPDGACPIFVPKQLFQAHPSQIVACDVGEDNSKTSVRLRKLWRVLFGKNCVPHPFEKVLEEGDVGILSRPSLTAFPSLQFSLTSDQKWQATMAGYISTYEELVKAGAICGAVRRKMRSTCAAFKRLELMCVVAPEGHLTRLTEELLVRNGLL